jgi:hypothetical protein
MFQKKLGGGKTGSVTISGTDFSGRAKTVKAKMLTRIESGNRTMFGLGWVTGLRLFP